MARPMSRWLRAFLVISLASCPAGAAPRTIYVDDNAPHDSSPGDCLRGDPMEDGSPGHPFDTIREAVDAAGWGDAVIVSPGTYVEDVRLLGKPLELRGVSPQDRSVTSETIIIGTVTFAECENAGASLHGLTIRGVSGNAAVRSVTSSPRITDCILAHSGIGLVIDCTDGAPTFSRCMVELGPTDVRQDIIRCADSMATFTDCLVAFDKHCDRRFRGQTYNLAGTPRSGPDTTVRFDPGMINGAVYVVEGGREIPTRMAAVDMMRGAGKNHTVPPVPQLPPWNAPSLLHPTAWDSTRPYIAPHLVGTPWSHPIWPAWQSPGCARPGTRGPLSQPASLHPSVSDPSLPYIAPHLLNRGAAAGFQPNRR